MIDPRSAAARGSLALLLGLPLLALLPSALLVGGCVDEVTPQAKQLVSDAGPSGSCLLGARACACTSTGGCDPGLLCSAGRCYDTEGTKDEPPDPDLRPPTPAPVLQPASAPDASTDSGPSSNG